MKPTQSISNALVSIAMTVAGGCASNSPQQTSACYTKRTQAPDMYPIRVRLNNGDSTTVMQDSI